MHNRIIRNVIFDWSGVISNDLESVWAATNLVFDWRGTWRISLDEFRQTFVLPYMDFWHKYLPDMTIEEENRLFLTAYQQMPRPKPYPGVKDLLETLCSGHINTAVLSSHNPVEIRREAKEYGILHLFRDINGGIVNKIDSIRSILDRNNFKPDETIFVGDMTHDIEAGQVAGVTTVALTWGYQDIDRLNQIRPDYLFNDIKCLLWLLRKPKILKSGQY